MPVPTNEFDTEFLNYNYNYVLDALGAHYPDVDAYYDTIEPAVIAGMREAGRRIARGDKPNSVEVAHDLYPGNDPVTVAKNYAAIFGAESAVAESVADASIRLLTLQGVRKELREATNNHPDVDRIYDGVLDEGYATPLGPAFVIFYHATR